MPLKGTEKVLGKKLADAMKGAPSYEEAWAIFSEIWIAHVTENAVVVGVAPSGGGPIIDGRVL